MGERGGGEADVEREAGRRDTCRTGAGPAGAGVWPLKPRGGTEAVVSVDSGPVL